MKLLDRKTSADAVRLLVFVLVTTLATGFLVVTIGNLSFGATRHYEAVFTDATGVSKGDDVRVAGVKVGNVDGVEVVDRDRALVSFEVDRTQRLTEATEATIRYRNLVGQRYVSLSQGVGGAGLLDDGDRIPLSRTHPALDLTVLFDGFKPLFAALTPSDVNQLSYEIVKVFQGEGGTLEGLLAHTASLTSTLARKDRVIGSLLTNLNELMVTVGDRDAQLSQLIVRLRQLVSGLSSDRQAILGSLDSVSDLAVQTSDLVTGIRPSLTTDVAQLRRVAGTLDRDKGEVDRALQVLPVKLTKIGRTATYGSFFNFYLCNFRGAVKLPAGSPVKEVPLDYDTGSARCDLG